MITRGLAAAALVAGGVIVPGSAGAAEIVRQEPPQRCELRLSGPIESGDSARFAEAMKPLADRAVVNLCLSSPGGVVQEAVGIIGQIRAAKATIRTIVDEGAACFSACALIFMSGGRGTGADRKPERRLHVTATLGFHAPAIRKSSGDYDMEVMRQAHLQALRGMSRLLAATDEQSIPMELFARLLLARPTEFLLVETLRQAGRWQIDLLGEAGPGPGPSRQDLRRACVNDIAWRADFESADDPQDTKPIAVAPEGRFRAIFPDFGDEAAFDCVADLYRAKDGTIYMSVKFAGDASELKAMNPRALEREVKASTDPLRRIGTPLWYGRAADTRIRTLVPPRPAR